MEAGPLHRVSGRVERHRQRQGVAVRQASHRQPTAQRACSSFSVLCGEPSCTTTSIGPFGVARIAGGRHPTALHRAATFPAFGDP